MANTEIRKDDLVNEIKDMICKGCDDELFCKYKSRNCPKCIKVESNINKICELYEDDGK